jgi:two-component system, NarL family, response regulator DesR
VIRILIASDLGLLRALRRVLDNEEDLTVSELGPRQDPVEVVRQWRPQVVLVDLASDGRTGLTTARRITQVVPGCAVIALAEQQSPAAVREALDAGVRGFTSAEPVPTELVELIRRVAAGDRVVDPATAFAALAIVNNPLTPRECEVLRLAADGLPTKSIARMLFLSDGTVRNHVWSILRKTGTRNRIQAIRRAREAGWI